MKQTSIQNFARTVALSMTMMILCALTAGPASAANGIATALSQSTQSCSTQATGDGFVVNWQSSVDADRFIVERYAFSRFWWRGRSADASSTFTDGAAPKGAASITYRVVAKSNQGATIATIPCPLQSSPNFSCTVTKRPDGTFSVEWSAQSSDQDNDIVVRRSVQPGGTEYWRTQTTDADFTDSASPTGQASYVLYARVNNRISVYTSCTDVVTGEECSAAVTELPAIECEALQALNDRGLAENPNTDPCAWDGIECANGHVTRIKIFGGLSGTIPPELGNLPNLVRLTLNNTDLSGPIPTELANLTNLTLLSLQHNELTGSIPPELGKLTKLEHLAASGNNLSGPIPSEVGSLNNLVSISLAENQLTGSIPPELGNLSNLTGLSLTVNQLSGPIPPELGALSKLTWLHLTLNNLSGPIPPELGEMTSLKAMILSRNHLTGPIPSELANLTNLDFLQLFDNELSGPVPAALGDLNKLTSLHLGENQLSGPIPSELGNLENLRFLSLNSNQLSGQIPAALGGLSSLIDLDLHDNQLSGTVPSELGNISDFRRLYLANNQLSGDLTAVFSDRPDAFMIVRLSDGPGSNNCFTVTDPATASWLAVFDADWDECD